MFKKLPEEPQITREQFMAFVRSAAFDELLSVEDRREVFLDALTGASDFTPELFDELLDVYGVDRSQIQHKHVYLVYNQTDYDCLADAVLDGAAHTIVETLDTDGMCNILNRLPSIASWVAVPVQ